MLKRGRDMSNLACGASAANPGSRAASGIQRPPLRADWDGSRDLHIELDLTVLYRVERNELHLAGPGAHTIGFDE